MSMQRESRRLQIQPHDGPADSTLHRKDSTCTQDHCSQGGEPQCPGPHLPEKISSAVTQLSPSLFVLHFYITEIDGYLVSYILPTANARCCSSCLRVSCI
ncbi:uncharacterized protein LOC125509842 isoform X3 [Triticum urartu]|uniref:uncharacterized protein LOC125509842 isoform X3 n=1 Tax=Triticum urartu TaxID=4572 RepID=UPI0020442451|nr:uncharacterized protein LOC125509842 isoform X3 [Triticum urartu]